MCTHTPSPLSLLQSFLLRFPTSWKRASKLTMGFLQFGSLFYKWYEAGSLQGRVGAVKRSCQGSGEEQCKSRETHVTTGNFKDKWKETKLKSRWGRGKRKKRDILLDHLMHCDLVFLPQRNTSGDLSVSWTAWAWPNTAIPALTPPLWQRICHLKSQTNISPLTILLVIGLKRTYYLEGNP